MPRRKDSGAFVILLQDFPGDLMFSQIASIHDHVRCLAIPGVSPFHDLAKRGICGKIRTIAVSTDFFFQKSQIALQIDHEGITAQGLDLFGRENLFAGRIEFLLDGTWEQFDDFTSSSEGDRGLMVGAAIDW